MTVPESESDERLLIEAAQEDPARFGDLYERHFCRVYAFVTSRVRSRQEAEDLTSDVFHRALAFLPRFQWRGVPFGAWLMKIASNVITDRSQRSAKRSEVGLEGDPPDVASEDLERRVQLFALVDRLPADQRRVIQMRFSEQRSIREIARELARTEGAVKQLQLRALRNLRARLGGNHG